MTWQGLWTDLSTLRSGATRSSSWINRFCISRNLSGVMGWSNFQYAWQLLPPLQLVKLGTGNPASRIWRTCSSGGKRPSPSTQINWAWEMWSLDAPHFRRLPWRL